MKRAERFDFGNLNSVIIKSGRELKRDEFFVANLNKIFLLSKSEDGKFINNPPLNPLWLFK